MKNKKLWAAIGPLLTALLLLGLILWWPTKAKPSPNTKELDHAASSMSVNVFKGDWLKNTAMNNDHYLPFFGSSELGRINAFHPSVMAQKYQRPYQPFLFGAPGTQSLTHFFIMQSMKTELKQKAVVFIISPQWFVKEGIGNEMFSHYYSPLQTNQWLLSIKKPTASDRYLAQRLLHFSAIKESRSLKEKIIKIKEDQSLTFDERQECRQQVTLLGSEDVLFTGIGLVGKDERIRNAAASLPANYDPNAFDQLARKQGRRATTNNPFGIANRFYSKKIAARRKELKGSQVHFSYLQSPEFSDFQLVLNELAKSKSPVLFVIPPVNQRWSSYTGLSTQMLDQFSKKITYQLQSQGFDHIVDYTDKRSQPYFMEDTIHLGWRGWLQLDRDLQVFLKEDSQKAVSYQLDNQKFLSHKWQQQLQ